MSARSRVQKKMQIRRGNEMFDPEKLKKHLAKSSENKNSAFAGGLTDFLNAHNARKRDFMDELHVDKLCDMLSMRGLDHSHGWFQYTTWTGLLKMICGSKQCPKKHLYLGHCKDMNDTEDKRCGAGTYFASFSYGEQEDVGMWACYGIPREEAIRIRIPFSAMIRWFLS